MSARQRRLLGYVCAAGLLLPASACVLHPAPESSPAATSGSAAADPGTDSVARVSLDTLREAAASHGVSEERVLEADRRAHRTMAAMEEATRRQFYELFGPDPLGLAHVPENAGRYEIPLETNYAVEWWIRYFQERIPSRLELYLERAGRYEDMIREHLRTTGLPEDLLYLAVIESGMNPNAYSRAGAAGIWQFIAGTARRYGLEVSYWIDERRDPVAATDAAIRHLSDLYDEFGSWYLAAAAYNAGAGRVQWGIARTGSEDYWDLVDARVLRRETRNYVPKMIAAALIARSPEAYGFRVEPRASWSYETVRVPDATSFDVIAEAAGVSEAEIERLNPRFRRRVTPPGRAVTVRVPAGHGETFAASYAEIPPSERVTWLVHTVTRGETLSHIARRYGTSTRSILAANDGLRPRRLQIGQRVLVPRMGSRSGSAGRVRRPEGPTTVVVRRGDSLWTIARRFDVSTRQLMAWNDLESTVIHPGDRIEIRN